MTQARKYRLDALERELTGPKRVGLFGHRAVGKTTLLAMLFREASSGRVALARLAAGDAPTAQYLADKITQIEAGEPPAGTLAETPLRLKLYHGMSRLELVVKDYQGEHIALGSDASIHDFLSNCDAVLLCLDGEAAHNSEQRRRRQLEIEALLERYIDRSDQAAADRPLAVVITKYDRVIERGGPAPESVESLVEAAFGMTRHALSRHAPDAALFAVSSYGVGAGEQNRPPPELRPIGLDAPLAWLAERFEAVDRERLEWLFDLAPSETTRLGRCLAAFERRYPRSSAVFPLKRRLRGLKRKRSFARAARLAAALAALLIALAGYDAWGYHDALQFERSGAPPADVEQRWNDLATRHPSLPWLFPARARRAALKRAEWSVKAATARAAAGAPDAAPDHEIRRLKERAPELAAEIARLEFAQNRAREEQAWNALRVADLAAVDKPAEHLAAARKFLRDFPETSRRDQAVALVAGLEEALALHRQNNDRQTLDDLQRAAQLPNLDHADLIEQVRAFLADRSDSPYRPEAESLLESLVAASDAADIERARRFSREHPDSFDARRERYLEYLRAHANGGRHVAEANAAIDRIDAERDAHLYRLAYDHHAAHPGDVPAVAERLNAYLDANPTGRFSRPAREYIAWWRRISTLGEYHVTLKRGRVEPNVGKPFAGAGPDLGVVLWVAGVEYGPSPIIKDSREPIWDHRFDSPIRWKYGDPVSIRIIDHDWSPTGVYTLTSRAGDKLAMRMLSGTVRPARGGRTELVFESDFREPKLPPPD